jgi:hypothetical protein
VTAASYGAAVILVINGGKPVALLKTIVDPSDIARSIRTVVVLSLSVLGA